MKPAPARGAVVALILCAGLGIAAFTLHDLDPVTCTPSAETKTGATGNC